MITKCTNPRGQNLSHAVFNLKVNRNHHKLVNLQPSAVWFSSFIFWAVCQQSHIVSMYFLFLCCWVMSINTMAAHIEHNVMRLFWDICYTQTRCTFCSFGQQATHIKHSPHHDSAWAGFLKLFVMGCLLRFSCCRWFLVYRWGWQGRWDWQERLDR